MILKSKMTFGLSLVLAFLFASSCALSSGGYVVSGKVIDASKLPISGVTVRLVDSGIADIVTGVDGLFTFSNVPNGTFALRAQKAGKVFSASFTAGDGQRDLSALPMNYGSINDVELTGVDIDKLTVSLIQGRGQRSPFEGQQVENIRGVITKITTQRQNGTYTVTKIDGTTTPQWLETDGFYMEAFGSDIDNNPTTSDGIFVCTHNHNFSGPKLLDSVPIDLAVGQVVTVSGTIKEVIPVDRFNNSEGYLSVTTLDNPTVLQMKNVNTIITQAAPDGVLLTYQTEAEAGLSGEQIRTLPWEDDSVFSLKKHVDVMESVEGMTVKVNSPVVTGSTYYNITPILADGGLRNGNPNKDRTSYGSMVLKANDYNSEIIYCDYAPTTWKTFTALPQTGDSLINSSAVPVLRGVVNYTFDGIYWISPLATQGWNFTPVAGRNDKTKTSSVDTYKPWRIGKTANSQFIASWPIMVKDSIDQNLTVASFNIENYCAEEDTYSDKKYDAISDVFLYNLRAPDIITVIEMGDDKSSSQVYINQSNAYAIPDGTVWAVKNFRTLINAIKVKSAADVVNFGSGIDYDFREIAPEENVDGGAPGVNIRVGFLFRTDRVQFVERGIKTNSYSTTAGDESTWPVPGDTGSNPILESLARSNVSVAGITGQDGITRPRLSQSPGRINAAPFRTSRKPLAGEFKFIPTGKTVFVIANHFGSKSGDTPLYGIQQPPTFGSEARRAEQGRAVYEIVNSILSIDKTAKVVVTGDLNDFQFSLTNRTLTGAIYSRENQILFSPSEELLPAVKQYSYLFRGNSQQIDHIYVSKAIFNNIATTNAGNDAVFIPHIDSIFSQNNKIETSDHDPLIVRLNLGGL